MLYPERMQRLRVVVHTSMTEQALACLQRIGAVQITDMRQRLTAPQWRACVHAHPAPDVRAMSSMIMRLARQIDLFDSVAPPCDEGFIKKLFAPAPPVCASVPEQSPDSIMAAAAQALQQAEQETGQAFADLERNAARRGELEQHAQVLAQLGAVPLQLEHLGAGLFCTALLCLIPAGRRAQACAAVRESCSQPVWIEPVPAQGAADGLLVVCLHEDTDAAVTAMRALGADRVEARDLRGRPQDARAQLARDIAATRKAEVAACDLIAAASARWRIRLAALREQLMMHRQRADALQRCTATGQCAVLEGWVPVSDADRVLAAVITQCQGLAWGCTAEPDVPAAQIPVKLRNPGILRHFELLVRLYAPPRYDEIDPTVLIAPSFIVFFGLMITDAMYGLVCLALGLAILRGGGRYYALLRSAGVLLSLGGASTVVMGALTGGWFGNLLTEYAGLTFLNTLVVINPMVDVARFLVFAIGLGLVHLNIGIVMGMVRHFRGGDVRTALQHVWILALEAALAAYALGAPGLAVICLVPAAGMLLLSEKGMALFGLTGLLGDALSYARLMALGLVSFGLAVAINALAAMLAEMPFVGWLLALLVLLGGHAFSFVLNLMGAFAHGVRLHFVEFFSKFYSGGGEEFVPFAVERTVTRSE